MKGVQVRVRQVSWEYQGDFMRDFKQFHSPKSQT